MTNRSLVRQRAGMADSPRIEELKRRVQLDPASIAFAALAEEYRRAGQFDDSIITCKAGLLRHPAYLSARVTLGRSLLELGRYDEARDELEAVLKVAPENLAAIRGLAEIHHRRGEIPETVPEGAAEEASQAASTAAEPTPPPAPRREPIPIRTVPVASLAPTASSEAEVPASPSAEAPRTETPREDAPRVAPPVVVPPLPVAVSAPVSVSPPPPPPPPPLSSPSPPIALEPRPVVKREHPDAASLPALEALLARIVRARQSLAATATDR